MCDHACVNVWISCILCRSSVQELIDGIYAVGRSQHIVLNREEICAVRKLCPQDTYRDVLFHQKVKIHGKVVVSKFRITRRTTKRNSYTVGFTTSQIPDKVVYGTIHKLLTLNASGEDPLFIALIKPFNVQISAQLDSIHYPSLISQFKSLITSDFLSVITEEEELIAVHLDDIQILCFDVTTSFCKLVTVLVNENEKDL